ncbi:MAG: hypothetical protein R2857_14745 [Vampirovibrionales bacterium]
MHAAATIKPGGSGGGFDQSDTEHHVLQSLKGRLRLLPETDQTSLLAQIIAMCLTGGYGLMPPWPRLP